MKKQSRFVGDLVDSNKQKRVEVRVDVIEYSEEGIFYVYSPALDLVGYGKTHVEARASWQVVLEEYITYTMNKKTITKDLQSRGWIVKRNKAVTPPSLTWMLENNSDLTNVYNKYDFSKRSESISLPVTA